MLNEKVHLHLHWTSLPFWLVLWAPDFAHAYIGPGLSIGTAVFGAFILISVLFALYAVIWFPLKRRLTKSKGSVGDTSDSLNDPPKNP